MSIGPKALKHDVGAFCLGFRVSGSGVLGLLCC